MESGELLWGVERVEDLGARELVALLALHIRRNVIEGFVWKCAQICDRDTISKSATSISYEFHIHTE